MLKLTKSSDGGESVWFWCNGCDTHHRFVTKKSEQMGHLEWEFDGNLESPTFSPSLLCNRDHADPERGVHRCHLFLKAGQVQYLSDCTHDLVGKTVPVEPPKF